MVISTNLIPGDLEGRFEQTAMRKDSTNSQKKETLTWLLLVFLNAKLFNLAAKG